MAIPRERLRRVVDAGHPDGALVGVPVSLLREMLDLLPNRSLMHVPVSLLREMLFMLPVVATESADRPGIGHNGGPSIDDWGARA